MKIGPKEILRLVKEKNLVENLSDEQLKKTKGCCLDLRLGKIYKPIHDRRSTDSYLYIEKRKTPHMDLIVEYDPDYDEDVPNLFVFKPEEYYLVKTLEKLNLSDGVAGTFSPETTLLYSGLILLTAIINPGYRGELTCGLYNVGKSNFPIELGAKIGSVMFEYVTKER